uniref:Immunoglobulin subtype domain-containing protein n=1 Tax=Oncorhynchus mykiss TaxID=8022 RepID=A0A8C7NN88_ONCMY
MASLVLSESLLNNRTGIIRRSDDEKPQFYEFPRPARFGMRDSLVLPRVRPEDAGTYLCLIRANIGQTNRESNVTLSVSTGKLLLTIVVTAWQGVTHTTPQCTMHLVEVSVIWTLCGFLILGLVKIALCLISMQVNQYILYSL